MCVTYTCKNDECEHEFEISVSPIIPAKTYGPPERCHPAEGGEFEPGACPECNQKVDEDTVYQLMAEELDSARENAAEAHAELMRERREDYQQESERQHRESWD